MRDLTLSGWMSFISAEYLVHKLCLVDAQITTALALKPFHYGYRQVLWVMQDPWVMIIPAQFIRYVNVLWPLSGHDYNDPHTRSFTGN